MSPHNDLLGFHACRFKNVSTNIKIEKKKKLIEHFRVWHNKCDEAETNHNGNLLEL